jgi:hypothetical protein
MTRRPLASVRIDDARNQRGIGVLMALMTLTVMAAVALALLATLGSDTKIAGHDVRLTKALNLAEAGVSEAVSRIRVGDVPDNDNPRMVSQIFLTNIGSVPVLGADSVSLPTAQPIGDWMPYSRPGRHSEVLTVQYKTNAARTEIFRYDSSLDPSVQTVSGYPIFTITSTGRVNQDVRHVQTEVFRKPVNVNAFGALTANVFIRFRGNSVVCGFDHRGDTPAGTGEGGRFGAGGCAEDNAAIPPRWEDGTDDVPGAWTSSTTDPGGASQQFGSPPIAENQTGFYAGPWDALQMTQAEFFSWVGSPLSNEPSPPRGIYYLDNNTTSQDQSGSFAYHGGNGEGFLYVDGDMTINGQFTFRGMIYIEGDLKINGDAWILGAVIVRGVTELKVANGGCTILFSKEAIQQQIAKHGGEFATLSWREF